MYSAVRKKSGVNDDLSILRERRLFAFAPARNWRLGGDGCGAAALALHEMQEPILWAQGGRRIFSACTLSAMWEPRTPARCQAMGGGRQVPLDFPNAERAGVSLRSLPVPVFLFSADVWIARQGEN